MDSNTDIIKHEFLDPDAQTFADALESLERRMYVRFVELDEIALRMAETLVGAKKFVPLIKEKKNIEAVLLAYKNFHTALSTAGRNE